jgi:hypothetical protein
MKGKKEERRGKKKGRGRRIQSRARRGLQRRPQLFCFLIAAGPVPHNPVAVCGQVAAAE